MWVVKNKRGKFRACSMDIMGYSYWTPHKYKAAVYVTQDNAEVAANSLAREFPDMMPITVEKV